MRRTRPVLLAVDGNSLHHRAWHAYGRAELTNSRGENIFAVYGFYALLAGICDQVNPDRLLLAFDTPSGTNERKTRWPQYKANRSDRDPDLYAQMDLVTQLAQELGLHTHIETGWEADDVVASAAAEATRAGLDTVIATSDRDSFALITDTTTVMRLASGLDNAQMLNPAALLERYGIHPHEYRSYAAMRGDTSDNLPGITGVGEKGATKILAALREHDLTVEAIAHDPDGWASTIGKALANKVAAGIDAWRLNMTVMEMRTDLPIDIDAAQLKVAEAHSLDTMRRWELPNLASRSAIAFCGRTQTDPFAPAADTTTIPDYMDDPGYWEAEAHGDYDYDHPGGDPEPSTDAAATPAGEPELVGAGTGNQGSLF